MDEKELYIKDNEASRAELAQAIDEMMDEYAALSCKNLTMGIGYFEYTPVEMSRDVYDSKRTKVKELLDVLYGRLYLAECPF